VVGGRLPADRDRPPEGRVLRLLLQLGTPVSAKQFGPRPFIGSPPSPWPHKGVGMMIWGLGDTRARRPQAGHPQRSSCRFYSGHIEEGFDRNEFRLRVGAPRRYIPAAQALVGHGGSDPLGPASSARRWAFPSGPRGRRPSSPAKARWEKKRREEGESS
jgi:hypothetical protein